MEESYENHYIDLNQLINVCSTINKDNTLEINVFKYETIRTCIERVLSEFEEVNDSGDLSFLKKKELSTSFLIAFNTLKHNDIIKEKYGEE